MFPEAPKKIALYIKSMIMPEFGIKILAFEKNDIGKVLEKTGKASSEVIYIENGQKNSIRNLFCRWILCFISSRHLYRMPYSLHEKSGLVSIPFNPEKVMLFRKSLHFRRMLKSAPTGFLTEKC